VSIKSEFNPIELPELTILTGLNGSGKTHLLNAINDGKCQIDNIPHTSCKYYSLLDFKVSETQTQNNDQIARAKQAAWQYIRGNNPNWINTSRTYFNRIFIENVDGKSIDHSKSIDFEKINIWRLKKGILEKSLLEKVRQYVEVIKTQCLEHQNFKNQPQYQSIKKAVKKCKKPIHLITQNDFKEKFLPLVNKDNHLAISIGTVFTNYQVARYNYFHSECERIGLLGTNEPINPNEIYKTFEEKFPKPWILFNDILNQIYVSTGGSSVFDFSITDPSQASINMDNRNTYVFAPQLIDRKSGNPRSFDKLSSGEKVLLALAVSIYEANDDYEFPEILLLDEIDATLHPSLIKSLIETIQRTFISRGTKVILATHSPTTVALAPEGSIHVVKKGNVKEKVIKSDNQSALDLVTEGYATLSEGLSIFDQISSQDLCIISEGKNSTIIEKACRELGQDDVAIISCFQGKSGKSQLKTLFQFFEIVQHSTKVLFVWDCDVDYKLAEQNNTYPFIFPKNPKNTIATKGIENMFPETVFKGFISTREDSHGNQVQEFDTKRKSDFEKHIIQNGKKKDFGNFECLIKEIQRIQALD